MTNRSYDSSASALINTLNWPTVADMIKVETACMVYKSINDLAPDHEGCLRRALICKMSL